MRRIDELHLEYPFAGGRHAARPAAPGGRRGRPQARRHADGADGHRGAVPQAEHQPAAPRARDLPVSAARTWRSTAPNQVWAMDITYIPMARGFVYLAAVMDWFSRRVLAWRVSITLDDGVLRRGGGGGPGAATASPRSSTPIRAASSPARSSRACCRPTASASAWTARAAGGTTCSSSGCGGPSSTRRSICTPTTRSPKPEPACAVHRVLQPRFMLPHLAMCLKNRERPVRRLVSRAWLPRPRSRCQRSCAPVCRASRLKTHGPSASGCSAVDFTALDRQSQRARTHAENGPPRSDSASPRRSRCSAR